MKIKHKLNTLKTILKKIFPRILQNRFWYLEGPSDIAYLYSKTLYCWKKFMWIYDLQRYTQIKEQIWDSSRHPWHLDTLLLPEYLLIILYVKLSDLKVSLLKH